MRPRIKVRGRERLLFEAQRLDGVEPPCLLGRVEAEIDPHFPRGSKGNQDRQRAEGSAVPLKPIVKESRQLIFEIAPQSCGDSAVSEGDLRTVLLRAL
jgi:hypothetical protein